MKNIFCVVFLCLFFVFEIGIQAAKDRASSYPFISGDTFRAYCDWVVDDTRSISEPSKVAPGNTIFVMTEFLGSFFKNIHSKIKNPYILVTHNSDSAIPGKFAPYLNDKKIIAWFGRNFIGTTHPKLHLIPIGLANSRWENGDTKLFLDALEIKDVKKNHLLYMNFRTTTYPSERQYVHCLFNNKPYCTVSSPIKDPYAYLLDLRQSKFVLSPRGNGIDCYRTWEALLMGAIPIVKSSSLNPLFENLPVLIVKDWNEITEDFLIQKWEEMQHQEWQYEKIYADYWLNLIDQFKQ